MGMKEKGSNDKPIEKDEVTGKDKKSGQLKAVPDPKKTKGLDPKLDEKTKIPGKDLEKPKLKKVKAEAISETPLEKLKRLENGERGFSHQLSKNVLMKKDHGTADLCRYRMS